MVFIGTLQSMLVPGMCIPMAMSHSQTPEIANTCPAVIFVAAQWSVPGDFGSLALTMLAVQLPLTALWASTSLEGRLQAAELRKKQVQQRGIAFGAEEGREKSIATDSSKNAKSTYKLRIPRISQTS